MLDAVVLHRLASGVFDSAFVQPIPQLRHGCAFVIFLEHIQNERSSQRINLKMLFLVDHVTDGKCAAVVLALQSIVRHTTDNLFGKVSGVIFSVTFQHRFKNDTLCALGDHLSSGYNFYTFFFNCALYRALS